MKRGKKIKIGQLGTLNLCVNFKWLYIVYCNFTCEQIF